MNNETHKTAAPLHQVVGQHRELMAKGTQGRWHFSDLKSGTGGIRTVDASGRTSCEVIASDEYGYGPASSDDAMLITVAINTMPALLAIAEAAQALADKTGYPCEGSADYHRRFADLRTALSLLPNPEVSGPPSGGSTAPRC